MSLLTDNALKITPELFEILKAKAHEARKHRPPVSPYSSASSSCAEEDDRSTCVSNPFSRRSGVSTDLVADNLKVSDMV